MSKPRVFLDLSFNGSPPQRIVIELFDDFVPKTAQNFRALCVGNMGKGTTTGKPLHYKGCVFDLIYKGFVAQAGDLSKHIDADLGHIFGRTSAGTVGESIYGGTFQDENLDLIHSGPGILSMSNDGPNTNGSRFLLTFSRQRYLDGCHVVFGKVIKGMETVQRIEEFGTTSGLPSGLVVIADCGEISEVKMSNVDSEQFGTPSGITFGLVVNKDSGKVFEDNKSNVIESDNPQSNSARKESIVVRKVESEAKLQKDNYPKKYESSDEKLEATLKNNVLETNGNDMKIASEKHSSNPHQHSDDPSKSRDAQGSVKNLIAMWSQRQAK